MKLQARETVVTVSGKTPLTKNKSYKCELLKKTYDGYVKTEIFSEAHFVITTDNDGYRKTYKAIRFVDISNIWDLNKLKEDLSIKCGLRNYFYKKLLPKDKKVYHRRTFGDLLEYYSPYGVTEKMLITALDQLKFKTYYCGTPKGMVFFDRGYDSKLEKMLEHYFGYAHMVVTKYTPQYLYNLLKS